MRLTELIEHLRARLELTGDVRVALAVEAHGQSVNGRPALATLSDLHAPEADRYEGEQILLLVAADEFGVVLADETCVPIKP